MSDGPSQQKPDDKNKTAVVEIDGEKYEVQRSEALVADLIRLVGADPADTDLWQVEGREQIPLQDDQRISVKPGLKFVTVSSEPTPVA